MEYIRVNKKFYERLSTPLQGVIYQRASDTQPYTQERIARDTAVYYQNHPDEGSPTQAEIDATIESLFLRGFLRRPLGV